MRVTEHCDRLELVFDNSIQEFGVKTQFAVAHPNAWHIRKKNPHMTEWDGQIHFCKPIKKGSNIFTLPVGFKARLLKFLEEEALPFEFVSVMSNDPIPFTQLIHDVPKGVPMILDEVQEAACRCLLNGRRVVIELGTATGKTETFINAIACLLQAHPEAKAAIIVPKKNLLTQTVQRIYERLPWIKKVGIVGDGKFEIDSPITVATAQTACGHDRLIKAEEIRQWLATVSTLVLDECHHAALSPQWQDVIAWCTPRWLWAVSAKVTFLNAKNKVKEMSLEGLFGAPAYRGFSKERTCPVTAVFHHHNSWKGEFDEQGLHGTFSDMLPCSYRLTKGQPWLSAFWRGPDKEGVVPEWMLVPNPRDIRGYHPETNEPIFRPDAMIKDEETGEFIYNPQRCVANKELFGVYAQGLDKKEPDKWVKVNALSRHVVYFTRHDVAIMEYAKRNQWAVNLAVECTRRGEAWAISTKRNRHVFKIMGMLRRAGVNAHSLTGDLNATQQKMVIEDVRNGAMPGLVAHHTIISEGTDIPRLIHLIKLDGISEEQVLEQQKGRVQRVFEGKKKGFIHIPRDLQESNLNKVCGQMVTYFRHRGIPIKKLIID